RLPYLRAAAAADCALLLFAKGDEHLLRSGPPTAWVDGRSQVRAGTARRNPSRTAADATQSASSRSGADVLGRITRVTDGKSQAKAGAATGLLVVDAPDWRVIPLENLL